MAALEQWPESGVPDNPGAWLMATAKHRAIDLLRRARAARAQAPGARPRARSRQEEPRPTSTRRSTTTSATTCSGWCFIACHPVLATEARVALTLRLLGGLTTEEIARAFLVPKATVAQRIVRAKRTLSEARVPFEVPRARARRAPRLGARGDLPRLQRGLRGDRRRRLDAPRALRRRAAPRPHPRHSRARRARGPRPRRADGDPGLAHRARGSAPGEPVLLLDQDRGRWDRCSSAAASPRWSAPSGSAARSAPTRSRPRSPPATPGRARRRRPTGRASPPSTTPSPQLAPSPVVELNRAVAVAMAFGPEAGLEIVDPLAGGALAARIPPPAHRARRPAGEAGPRCGGPRGVRARRRAHPERPRAHPARGPRRRLRREVTRSARVRQTDHPGAG